MALFNKNKNKNTEHATFGGSTAKSIKDFINKIESGAVDTLKVPEISANTRNSLINNDRIDLTQASNLEQELAILFSEGRIEQTIEKIRAYINKNGKDSEQIYWLLLLDAYQYADRQADFDNIAMKYFKIFEVSPPNFQVKITKDSGWDNVLILPDLLTVENSKKFRPFFQASKKEKKCKINFSKCNFHDSDVKAINSLYTLLSDLRNEKIVGILIGEQNLIDFCLDTIEEKAKTNLTEETSWLLYLEILLWNNNISKFEEKSLEYAQKFEVSPPYLDESWLIKQQKNLKDNTQIKEQKEISFENINSKNIDEFLTFLESKKIKDGITVIDCTDIHCIAFSIAIKLLNFIETQKDTKYFFKNINNFTSILLDMTGIRDLIHYQEKKV